MASDWNRVLDTLLLLLHSYQHVRALPQSSCLPRPSLRKIEEESSKFDVALLQLDHLGVAGILLLLLQPVLVLLDRQEPLGPAQLGVLKCFMISRLSKFMWSRPLPSLHLDHPDQLRLLQRLLLVLQLRLHHVDVRLQSRQILLQAFQCFTHSKVYKCNQCEYETRRASSLRLHKKMHPGEKTHICTLCDFSGITSGKLKVYMMRKHIREKPYKCKQCNYACIQVQPV